MERKRGGGWRGLGVGAAALLCFTGAARAEPRVAEIGRITVDGDKAELSGDIEVGGELVGAWELAVRKVEADGDALTLVGRMTATLESGGASLKESVDDARVSLSDPQAVCGELVASADELRFERLGLVVYHLEREADITAKTARGRALTSLLCATTHVIDGEDSALLPALSTMTALANREVWAIAPQAAASKRSATAQAPAPSKAAPVEPAAAPVAAPLPPSPSAAAATVVVLPEPTGATIDPGLGMANNPPAAVTPTGQTRKRARGPRPVQVYHPSTRALPKLPPPSSPEPAQPSEGAPAGE